MGLSDDVDEKDPIDEPFYTIAQIREIQWKTITRNQFLYSALGLSLSSGLLMRVRHVPDRIVYPCCGLATFGVFAVAHVLDVHRRLTLNTVLGAVIGMIPFAIKR